MQRPFSGRWLSLPACLAILAIPASVPATTVVAIAPNLFGTSAVQIRADRFSGEWQRARRDASRVPAMQQLIAPVRNLSPDSQLAYVQAAVNRRIRWTSDTTLWGKHDYWASAAQTLAAGAGDDEDRAIVKMQALRALGFPTNNLYLTLGRDRVAGPETVLVVRLGGRVYVLDDSGTAPYVPEHRPEFSPVLSFGYGGSWVHAQLRVAPIAAAAAGTAFRGDRR